MRIGEDDNNFLLQKYNSNFETHEISPGINDVSNINNTSDNLVKAIVSTDVIEMKSRLKTIF